MTNLISSDILIANVKSFLQSFDNLDLIEDSDLYSWIGWVNNRLGVGVKSEKELISKVKNFKVPTPQYFSTLWSVHGCDLCSGKPKDQEIEFNHSITYEKRDFYSDGNCTIARQDDPTIVTEKWTLKNKAPETTTYCGRTLLSLGSGIQKSRIHSDCPNAYNTCENNFNLDSNYFYFNFTDAYVHIQYFADAFDEQGYPMVVDDEYVIKALEDYLIFKSLQKLFINGVADVQTRMMYYQGEHNTSLKEALFNQKLDSFTSIINAAKRRPQYLEIYNLRSTSDGRINNF
jgi:hypothetical protein